MPNRRRFLIFIWSAMLSYPAAAATPMDVSLAARAFQPGELVVVTVSPTVDASLVTVSAFGRTVSAFLAGPRRWEALVGIDVAQPPGTYRLRVDVSGADTVPQTTTRRMAIVARTFPTRRLRVDPSFVEPDAKTVERISREQAFLGETFKQSAQSRLWEAPFARPVPGQATSAFGARSVFNGQVRGQHTGADFVGATGTPIVAPNAGRIVAARDLFFTGNTVIIDHGLGVFSTLAHLSRVDVVEGATVEAGAVIGLVGATGRVTGPHLHWSLRVAGARVDPESLLQLLGKRP